MAKAMRLSGANPTRPEFLLCIPGSGLTDIHGIQYVIGIGNIYRRYFLVTGSYIIPPAALQLHHARNKCVNAHWRYKPNLVIKKSLYHISHILMKIDTESMIIFRRIAHQSKVEK